MPVTPSKFLYEWLVFIDSIVRKLQSSLARTKRALSRGVAEKGVSRPRSSWSSTFGYLDRSAVLQVSAALG